VITGNNESMLEIKCYFVNLAFSSDKAYF